jgi:hypothetical protein
MNLITLFLTHPFGCVFYFSSSHHDTVSRGFLLTRKESLMKTITLSQVKEEFENLPEGSMISIDLTDNADNNEEENNEQ